MEERLKRTDIQRVLLIDENELISTALKLLIEKTLMNEVAVTTSINCIQDKSTIYDYVILNLTYYCNYQDIDSIIRKIEKCQFRTLIILSNICMRNLCLRTYKKYHAIILCKNNLLAKDFFSPINESKLAKRTEDCYERNCEIVTIYQNGILNFTELSLREKEVLTLIGKGNTSSEIGDKLYITKKTVDFHRRNLLRKLSCRTSAELIVFATLISNNIV